MQRNAITLALWKGRNAFLGLWPTLILLINI